MARTPRASSAGSPRHWNSRSSWRFDPRGGRPGCLVTIRRRGGPGRSRRTPDSRGTTVAEECVPELRSILIADDNGEVRDALALALHAEGFDVRAARDAYEARRLFVASQPDLVLTDIRMPGDGMTLLSE